MGACRAAPENEQVQEQRRQQRGQERHHHQRLHHRLGGEVPPGGFQVVWFAAACRFTSAPRRPARLRAPSPQTCKAPPPPAAKQEAAPADCAPRPAPAEGVAAGPRPAPAALVHRVQHQRRPQRHGEAARRRRDRGVLPHAHQQRGAARPQQQRAHAVHERYRQRALQHDADLAAGPQRGVGGRRPRAWAAVGPCGRGPPADSAALRGQKRPRQVAGLSQGMVCPDGRRPQVPCPAIAARPRDKTAAGRETPRPRRSAPFGSAARRAPARKTSPSP